MARRGKAGAEVSNIRGYWQEELDKAHKRWGNFITAGDRIHDRYMLERANSTGDMYQDRYNILYSSTETIMPSLYAKTPKVQATQRHKDRSNEVALAAVTLVESIGQYALEEVDFDGVVKNAVKDYLLPGLGNAWVRYNPEFEQMDEGERVSFDGLGLDWVSYTDFRCGVTRTWLEMPWVARRAYMTPQQAKARFGADKANKLSYSYQSEDTTGTQRNGGGSQAVVWEIWDKVNRNVIWFSEDYAEDVLDQKPDPLKLKGFFPCPEPLRAVWTTRSFIPKAYYAEYKAQAEELDDLTARIRVLTKALRVIGVYDSSQTNLERLLHGTDNKMVPIENWAAFSGSGGLKGALEWVPIREVVETLTALLSNREVVKNEIYEITGFSDIVRGVSKASETLGAQEIKANWAGGRLRSVQAEVQRFCRDLIRIMTEIMCEHFSEETLAMYSGFEPPPITPEEQQAAAQYSAAMMGQVPPSPDGQPQEPPQPPPPTQQAEAIKTFSETVALLKKERERCALIGIETDSTIQPDEAAERKDRLEFLGQIGAFLQQAAPMAMQYPDMRGLMGSIMMFAVRTFRASRPIEQAFEEFTKKLEAQPPMAPPGSEGETSDPAAAQAQVDAEQIKAQATAQAKQQDVDIKRYEIDQRTQLEREKMQMEFQFKERELAIKERELGIKEQTEILDAQNEQTSMQLQAQGQERDAARADRDQEHREGMDVDGAERADRQLEADKQAAKAKASQKPAGGS